MSRRIMYKIPEKPEYLVTEEEWDEVRRLQHWYNSEFTWTTGRLALRRYVVFPNVEEFAGLDTSIWSLIEERTRRLRAEGMSEEETVRQLERDRLVFVKWGGYYDDCLASGFTRVADNEWNALLVCDFLLKVSTLIPHVMIELVDEGRFVRTGRLWLRDGVALVDRVGSGSQESVTALMKHRRLFAVVDPARYDRHPGLKNLIPNFNDLGREDRMALVQDWNWLGYESRSEQEEVAGGFDLNRKLRGFDFLP